MRRILPDTLGGRIVLVLLVGLLTFHVGSLWLHQTAIDSLLGSTRELQAAERLVAAKRAIADTQPADRDRTAHALSSAGLDFHWTLEPTVRATDETSGQLDALRKRLLELVPALGDDGMRLGYATERDVSPAQEEDRRHLLLGALRLTDGSWLNFSAALFKPVSELHPALLSTSAMALGILLLGLIVVRLIARPLQSLAAGADCIGGSGTGPAEPVSEKGPREVRHAAQAFNRMQDRIDRLISDRTLALAAVSHDLRTPIARLRLRAGFLDDPEIQKSIDADLDEMEAMIDATLAYLRGDGEQEKRRDVDVVAIVQTLCDNASDAGHGVSYSGDEQAHLTCRPVAIKRALANLIDNAVKYGNAARVRLYDQPACVVVEIDDDGPGIPEDAMEAVFEPFYRLEQSRNRQSGGSGLGLTIARRVVEAHQGCLRIANRHGGGLAVHVELPRSA